jgi:hypothetical protein
VCTRANRRENERENETELQLIRAASQIFFFFSFFFARGRARAPGERSERKNVPKKFFFGATRFVPASKVHRESKGTKNFPRFAPRARA